MSRGAPEERPAGPSPNCLRSYSVILAAEIGEPAAQMFHRIWYFCTRTDSGRVVVGRRWIRNSFFQWRENHFPHWGLNTVKRAVQILTDRELIHKGSHNQAKQDRTLWYAVNFDHPLLRKAGYIDHKTSAQNGSMQNPKMGRCKDPKRTDAKTQNGSMHRPKMDRSYKHRDNRVDNQSRPSSSPGREEDAIIDEQISRKMQERSTGPDLENVVTPPPDPSDDLLRQIYGARVPPAVDFAAARPKSLNLNHYLRPFQNREAMKKLFPKEVFRLMEKPGPDALEAKCAAFVDRVLRDHFKNPGQGAKTMALRACRGGFLNRCGFKDFCGREFYNRMEYSDANAVEIEL
jgi:hypothetical protein